MAAPIARQAAVVGGLELVVALLGHPLGELGENLLDVEPGHQPAQHRREHAQVAHVGDDGVADPGVLDLDRQLATVGRPGTMHLADAGGRRRLRLDALEHLLGRLAPLRGEHRFHVGPTDGGDVVAQRGQAALQVLGLVGIEAGELDRGEHLPGLHRGAAHDRELVDQRVDRCDHAIAPATLLIRFAAAGVDPASGPAGGAAGGDAAEPRRARDPPEAGRFACSSAIGSVWQGRSGLPEPDRRPVRAYAASE